MTVVDDLLAERDRLMNERQGLLERALNAEAEVEGFEAERAGDDIAIETLRAEIARLQAMLDWHHRNYRDAWPDRCAEPANNVWPT